MKNRSLSLTFLLCVLLCSCVGNTVKQRVLYPPVDLNATLTNQMSDTSVLYPMEKRIESYMKRWHLKGAQLAIMRRDSLLYAKGFGWADEENKEPMTPAHKMRLASVSKLITATGIMKLEQDGLLSLDDKVFGPEGILDNPYYCNSITDTNYYNITVEDLLRHKGGFTRRAGDPLFSCKDIMARHNLSTPPTAEETLRIQLKRRLYFKPGTDQEYSNLGYLILSMIIEKISGLPYRDFIQEELLTPAGCLDFQIAGNYLKDRKKGEVYYYDAPGMPLAPEYNNSGRKVKRCYGGNDITALSGAGAWIASAPEIALFVASIDGREEIRDVINPDSVSEMTRYIDSNTYSLGWNDTNPENGWVRTGTLSGTTAMIKYFPDGECWIFLSNTSTWRGPEQARHTADLFDELRHACSNSLPSRDLFHEHYSLSD